MALTLTLHLNWFSSYVGQQDMKVYQPYHGHDILYVINFTTEQACHPD
jgi:hypothetical protein